MTTSPQIVREHGKLKLRGELRIADATELWRELREQASRAGKERLDIDLSEAGVVDGAVMALLVELRDDLFVRGIPSEIVGASERLKSIVHLYRGDEPARTRTKPPHEHPLSKLGRAAESVVADFRRLCIFLGSLVAAAAKAVVSPATMNWKSLPGLAERAGADGIPIVLLLNFLVGFVMAFQSARQLKLYGANVYVADVVGISVTRELGPLMTAIIMSGRSGASFASELGSMRVSEEIDALRTMGFAPAPYLILPRMAALAIVAPVLTLLGDIVGVVGGMAVAVTSLDVSARGYLAELRTAIIPADVWTGLAKSVAFGLAIAFIGCQQGISTQGAAAGVGRSTTTTVVSCLFTIVVVDTVFTLLFRALGQ